ncbi:MAG: aminotransferase class V-fold PLP-dependent enzyme [Acidiferrobacteraceae bacterium]
MDPTLKHLTSSDHRRAAETALDRLIASEFPGGGPIYLNHAAVAPWPQRTADVVKRFAEQSLREGAWVYPEWLATETKLRTRAARLLGTRADDIAFTKNTSEALSFVAYGFPWRDGDAVVFPQEEFPSNRIVWESLAPRVAARSVRLTGERDPEAALIKACDHNVRLLAVSSVQYATGLRLDLSRLGAVCHRAGIAFCVDAIQGLGYLPHGVDECHIDFLVADGHKWLLGPEGLALFYCRDEWRDRLVLHEFGWHMVDGPGDFDRIDWQPARSAQRFECGSPNMLGVQALNASLSLIEEIGVPVIGARVLERTGYLIDALARLPRISVMTDPMIKRRSGIVTFMPQDGSRCTSDTLLSALIDHRVFCARRGGGIRLSPHFYTPIVDLDTTLEIIKSIC